MGDYLKPRHTLERKILHGIKFGYRGKNFQCEFKYSVKIKKPICKLPILNKILIEHTLTKSQQFLLREWSDSAEDCITMGCDNFRFSYETPDGTKFLTYEYLDNKWYVVLKYDNIKYTCLNSQLLCTAGFSTMEEAIDTTLNWVEKKGILA